MTRAGLVLAMLVLAAPVSAATEWSRFPAMGTSVEIAVRHEDAAGRKAALDAARLVFERYGREWYPWRKGSALHRVNAALANGEGASASPELIELLREARRLSCLSGRRFDPAIGRLVRLWGFDRPPPYEDPAPGRGAIAEWRAADADATDLQLSAGTITSSNPAVQLDLGGIAKGALIDRALAVIRRHGVEHAMVNAGGDLVVIGTAQGRPWRAGIRDPRGNGLLASIDLQPGEALFTSGDYERFREAEDGRRLGHILDPRTGRPVHEAIQTSVVAKRGALADAAATALMVAGRADWSRVAGAMELRHVLLIDRNATLYADPRLADRLEWVGGSRRLTTRPIQEVQATGCD